MLKSGIGLGFTAGFLVTNKFDRIVKARDLAIKRSIVEVAQEQFRSKQPEVASVPIPPQPSEKDRKGHEMTHTPFQPWCKFCVMSRSRANQHPHVADHAQDAQREHPTVQCDFFVMEAGKEDAVVALLMVDVWSRYVSVVLKPRNTQTVGNARMKFLNEVDRAERAELPGDNEWVLAAGMRFCQSARQRLGLETILTWNQTIRGLRKTLICHLEFAIQASIPAGHAMIHWAAMHAAWIYSRFHVHACLKATQFQSLFGRPYRGKIPPFGQVVFGLDPKKPSLDQRYLVGKGLSRYGSSYKRWQSVI